jgi:tetratricopeptide (TPR) repeat protein
MQMIKMNLQRATFLITLLTCLLIAKISFAEILTHSPGIQSEYLKYHQKVFTDPQDKRALFDLAMTLAYMGKPEKAGKQLGKINELDNDYAYKILNILENERTATNNNWRLDFKTGFVYYFLYEEAIGRIALSRRRIKRRENAPDNYENSEATIIFEKDLIAKKLPLAEKYKKISLAHFQTVADKIPQDNFNTWGYAYMAVVEAIEHNWPKAKELCEKALEITPNSYAIRAAYTEALRQNGDFFGALSQMTTAYRLRSEQEAYEKELFGEKYELP